MDPHTHMSPWSCLNCNFFFQMMICPEKDQQLGSCTEPDSRIDFSIIHQSLGQLKKKPSAPHLNFRITDVVKDVCLLFCFALNETIMEAFPKVLLCLIGCCLCIKFWLYSGQTKSSRLESMCLLQGTTLALLG